MKTIPAVTSLVAHEWGELVRLHTYTFPLRNALLTVILTGHVFGMIHEHQRLDAITYVHFECANLADYEDVKKRVEASKDNDAIEDVCKDGKLAVKYGSMANDWTPTLYGFGQDLKSRKGAFDKKSIM
jgi:hypothetical protein